MMFGVLDAGVCNAGVTFCCGRMLRKRARRDGCDMCFVHLFRTDTVHIFWLLGPFEYTQKHDCNGGCCGHLLSYGKALGTSVVHDGHDGHGGRGEHGRGLWPSMTCVTMLLVIDDWHVG